MRRVRRPARLVLLLSTPVLAGSYVALGLSEQERRRALVVASSVGRFARAIGLGLSVTWDYKSNLFRLREGSDEYNTVLESCHWRSAEKIFRAACANGGLYIKVGQGVAVLNHLLPKAYVTTLSRLNDMSLAVKEGEIEEIMREDLGLTLDEAFEGLEPEPIAAASIAQVFRARRRPHGEPVAVKVQYIDLQHRFSGDVWTITTLMDIADVLFPSFNFKWAILETVDSLHQELDFIHEARNAERCAEDLAQFPFVHVPKVHWDLTSKRLLTMEFVDGVKADDAKGMKEAGIDIKDACHKICQVFGHQIFRTGFVHADPHPGNVFVRKVGGNTQVVLLDHGLYQELDPAQRNTIGGFWKSMILDDRRGMQIYAKQLGVTGHRNTEVLAGVFLQRPFYMNIPFSKYFRGMTKQDVDYMNIQVIEHFDQIMHILRTVPSSFLLVLRNLNTIRAIMQTHGNPVNRYKIFTNCTVERSLRNFTQVAKLSFRLFKMDVTEWIRKTLLYFLLLISRKSLNDLEEEIVIKT